MFPCRLFIHTVEHPTQSSLASPSGWSIEKKWKKLYERIPEHERNASHKRCYLAWRELQIVLESSIGIDASFEMNVLSEAQKWKKLFTRIIDVVIFLGERGLPFRGSSERIGDVHNANFLGLLELLASYDTVLQEHVSNVKISQQRGK